jgi:DNA-binding NarL/FixJ family response regulator
MWAFRYSYNLGHPFSRPIATFRRKTLDSEVARKLNSNPLPLPNPHLNCMKTVYIIEDEENLRTLLSTFFATTFPDLEVLGMTSNGGEGIEQCLKLEPDLVIIDVQLPEVNGLEILHLLKRNFPKIKVLIFSGQTSPQTIKIAVRGNADGFINKISGLEELTKAIHAVQKDEQFFSPEIYDQIVRMREEGIGGQSRPLIS